MTLIGASYCSPLIFLSRNAIDLSGNDLIFFNWRKVSYEN